MSYSHMGTPTLPSAQLRFTAEFGKGSGGTTALLSPSKNLKLEKLMFLLFLVFCNQSVLVKYVTQAYRF